jgi:hypothetical protein
LATPNDIVIQVSDLACLGIQCTNEPPLPVVASAEQAEVKRWGDWHPGSSPLRPAEKAHFIDEHHNCPVPK